MPIFHIKLGTLLMINFSGDQLDFEGNQIDYNYHGTKDGEMLCIELSLKLLIFLCLIVHDPDMILY